MKNKNIKTLALVIALSGMATNFANAQGENATGTVLSDMKAKAIELDSVKSENSNAIVSNKASDKVIILNQMERALIELQKEYADCRSFSSNSDKSEAVLKIKKALLINKETTNSDNPNKKIIRKELLDLLKTVEEKRVIIR